MHNAHATTGGVRDARVADVTMIGSDRIRARRRVDQVEQSGDHRRRAIREGKVMPAAYSAQPHSRACHRHSATVGHSGRLGYSGLQRPQRPRTDGRVREFDAVDFERDVVYVVTLGHPALYLHDTRCGPRVPFATKGEPRSASLHARALGVLGVLVRLPGCRAYRLANLDQGVLPDPLILLQQRSVHGTRRITS